MFVNSFVEYGELDSSKCKSILTWVKQRITTIIRNYNRSGNGAQNAAEKYQFIGDEEDKVDETESNEDKDGDKYGFFNLDKAMQEGGDDRKNFLDRLGYPSDVLYWWQVLQDLDILQATCAIFNRELGVSSIGFNESVATLDARKREARKRNRDDPETAALKKKSLVAMQELSKSVASIYSLAKGDSKHEKEREIERHLSVLYDKKLVMIRERYSPSMLEAPKEVRDEYDTRIERMKKEIKKLEDDIGAE